MAGAFAIRPSVNSLHSQASSNTNVGRSPCPLLNSLANHGFLRRSGRNITGEELVGALHASINFDPAAVRIPTAVALSTSQTGNDSTFGLDNLNLHGGEILHQTHLERKPYTDMIQPSSMMVV